MHGTHADTWKYWTQPGHMLIHRQIGTQGSKVTWKHSDTWTHGHMGREEAHPDTWSHEYRRTHEVTCSHMDTYSHMYTCRHIGHILTHGQKGTHGTHHDTWSHADTWSHECQMTQVVT